MVDPFPRLNASIKYPSHVRVVIGEGNLPKVVLTTSSGASAEVYLNGGHLTSFKRGNGEEVIFMSTKAVFSQGKAIRGGVPICFPQFGPGELVQHGFARTSQWDLKESHPDSIVLELLDSDDTFKLWPNLFCVHLTIQIKGNTGKESLIMELNVKNRNIDKSFLFTTALHTYFKIKDVHSVSVHGLKGTTYVDKVSGGKKVEEDSDDIQLSGETDRVYQNAKHDVKMSSKEDSILLKRHNFPDVVVWNLWSEKAKAMADMGDDDWVGFICAEAASTSAPVMLEPGHSWKAWQEISKL